MNILEVKRLSKVYEGAVPYQALHVMDFAVAPGEFVGIMGPSGSGKTTLLNVISTIDVPTSGQVVINGQEPHRLSGEALARFRRTELGFVFQDFNLLDTLTVRENIFLPMCLEGVSVAEMNRRLADLASLLGIEQILDKRPYQISGGQAQRAAIARAVIHKPSLVLADEPTGNLDSKSARDVMELFQTLNEQLGVTILMVTHDPVPASFCSRILFIKDGRIYNEIRRGRTQQAFYENILDVLAMLGGRQP